MQLRDVVQDIRARGAELVVVGNGQPHHAQGFRDEHQIAFPLLVDPDLAAYSAAGLRRGIGSTFNARSIRHALRALGKGFRQGWTQGDPWQQGGAFVITPESRVLFEHVSRDAGDHVEPARILAALPEAPRDAGGGAFPT